MTKKERIERLEFEVDQLQTAIAALQTQIAQLQVKQTTFPNYPWNTSPTCGNILWD